MEGTVIKSTGSWYTVRQKDETKIECKIRGIFRIKDLNVTNPIAVGDNVVYEITHQDRIGVITDILKRKNYIIRRDASNARQAHILAANLDRAIIVVTLTSPKTPIGFVDRFLLTAESFNVPANIIFNKIDIYDKNQLLEIKTIVEIYENIGYSCYLVSAKTGENIDLIKNKYLNKVSLFTGNSGVGKSAIINAIDPAFNLKTEKISESTGKGVHTTSAVEMYEFSKNSYIIDTPGIKELGIVDIEPYEISHFFPEMRVLIGKCQYNNCLHISESKCAVKEAVEQKKIHQSRYFSYLSIAQNR